MKFRQIFAAGTIALATVGAVPGISGAIEIKPGIADCSDIWIRDKRVHTECANGTNHDVIVEVFADCRPGFQDAHSRFVLSPRTKDIFTAECSLWSNPVGGSASVHR